MSKQSPNQESFRLAGELIAALLREAGYALTESSGVRQLLPMKAAAKRLGMGQTKFRQLEIAGTIPKRMLVSGMPRWDSQELDRYVESTKRQRDNGEA